MKMTMYTLTMLWLAGSSLAQAQVIGQQLPMDCPSCFPPAGNPLVVVNNPPFPVWTRNADDMAPVQVGVTLQMGGDLQKSAVLFTVPNGKRLVITKVGTDGERSPGQRTHLSLLTTVEGNQSAVPFPLTPRYGTVIGSTTTTSVYADSGTQVVAQLSRPVTVGPWNTFVRVSITGYLVKK